MSEDDGTASSCSFIILHPRDLPRIPSADLPSPDQTYSNLTFLNPAQERLYESVSTLRDRREQPSPTPEEVAPKGREDRVVGAEYAKVLKVKKRRNEPGQETGTAHIAGMLLTPPQAVQV